MINDNGMRDVWATPNTDLLLYMKPLLHLVDPSVHRDCLVVVRLILRRTASFWKHTLTTWNTGLHSSDNLTWHRWWRSRMCVVNFIAFMPSKGLHMLVSMKQCWVMNKFAWTSNDTYSFYAQGLVGRITSVWHKVCPVVRVWLSFLISNIVTL